jgi:hypothetical protein
VGFVLVSKKLLNIYHEMGFRPYSALSKEDRRAIGVEYYGALFGIFQCWWRKLDNGLWDWIDPRAVEERE